MLHSVRDLVGKEVKTNTKFTGTLLDNDGTSYAFDKNKNVINFTFPVGSILRVEKLYDDSIHAAVSLDKCIYTVNKSSLMTRASLYVYSDKLSDLNNKTGIFND